MAESCGTLTIAVIGGGPAGLLAAGTAAAGGAKVLLLEKNSQCGRKLLITGAGRCNISSGAPFAEFMDQYPENKKFLYPAFRKFFVEDLRDLLQKYNLALKLEENGKYFPATGKASSVLEALVSYCAEHQVDFHFNEAARSIASRDGKWEVASNKKTYVVDSVILATGGMSVPQTGSDGSGHRIAAAISHEIVPTRPALVSLRISRPDCSPLSGISLSGAAVELQGKNRGRIAVRQGDLLFTHSGVSGPAVLFLSRWLPAGFDENPLLAEYSLCVDLIPSLNLPELDDRLISICESAGKSQLKNALGRNFSIPYAVAAMIIGECGMPEDLLCHEMTRKQRQKLAGHLKCLRLEIAGTGGYREAMVTAGGINTRQINPRTMESAIHPGLYFAGEIIDIDGNTGGYNLQAAFSTGYLAGKSAALGRS